MNFLKWEMRKSVGVSRAGVMLFWLAGAGLCQQASGPRPVSAVPILGYKFVNWPTEVTSEAGFPAGPWNLIQAPAAAVARNGHILVLHRGAHPILEFEAGGKFVRSWGDGMFSEGKVVTIPPANRTPTRSGYSAVYGPAGCDSCGAHSLRVDTQGNIWAVDAANHMVFKMDPQGKTILRLGKKGVSGASKGNFYLPTDVAFAANGDIYVSDGYGNARVVKFTRDGKYLLEFGKRGTGPGEFGLPRNVVVDSQGKVYVTDRENQRVEVFDPDGKFLHQWKTFGGVSTLFITKDQHIWAGGFLHNLDGKVLGRLPFPEGGGGGGHGTAVTESGDVFLAQLNGQVHKFVKTAGQ